MAKRSFKGKSRRNRNRSNRKTRNRNQRGGMAEWSNTGEYRLLGPADAVHAQVGSLDAAFGELPSVIPQRGGVRRNRRNRTKTRTNKRTLSRKRNHSRRQKGGMSPFGDTGRSLTDAQYAADGTNPQFRTEVDVNERYTGF
jgi:hypothetical protein